MVDVAGADVDAEDDRRDDRGLGSGVEAFNVGGRVGLGVAQRLGVGERIGVVGTLLRHLREDVVGGAVDDAHHAGHVFTDERFAQRTDERDAAGDGGFEEQIDARIGRDGVELRTMSSQQFLVAGDDGLAVLECGANEGSSRLETADELDDEIDLRIGDDRGRVGREQRRVGELVSVLGDVANGDRPDRQLDPGPLDDGVAAGGDQVDEGTAHVSAAEESDGEVGHGAERSR